MRGSYTHVLTHAACAVLMSLALPTTSALARSLVDLSHAPEQSVRDFVGWSGARLKSTSKKSLANSYVVKSLPTWHASDIGNTGEMTVAEFVAHRPQSELATKNLASAARTKKDYFASAAEIAGVQIRVYPKAITPSEVPKPIVDTPPVILTRSVAEGKDPPRKNFRISDTGGRTKISPDALRFSKVGEHITVDIDASLAKQGEVQLFVRDQTILAWDAASKVLQAKADGASELYVVVRGIMRIVPVLVGGDDVKGFEIPEKLASLDGIVPAPKHESARFLAPDNSDLAEEPSDDASDVVAQAEREIADANAADEAAGQADLADVSQPAGAPVSIQDSAAQAARTHAAAAEDSARFDRANKTLAYTRLALQVVDDRSRPEQGIIYPVIGAQVYVVGTEFVATTDGSGNVLLRDMPRGSRFLVNIRHADGVIRPTVAEVETPESGSVGVIRIKVMRFDAFDNYAAMARISQRADTASLCISLRTTTNRLVEASAGVAVALDVAAEGPVYFNQYGFVDPDLRATGQDGRACFFNVDPGPILLQLSSGAAALGSVVMATTPGMHSEETVDLADTNDFEVGLGIIATAAEQLGSDRQAADGWRPIDAANVVSVGDAEAMRFVRDGFLASQNQLSPGGRKWMLTQTGEFEPAVQAVTDQKLSRAAPILSLIPRGFVQDMAEFAQVSHDQSLGAVLIEHGFLQGQGQGPIALRLLNESGAEVGEGWYFSDKPTTKALFFNVQPGRYALLVETNDRYWLAAQSLVVYSETLTVVQTGSPAILRK